MVSVGTSAKCRSQTVMLLKDDKPFFKPKVIYSLDMLFLISEIFFYGVQNEKGKRVLGKFEIINARHIVSFVADKRNSVDF